MGATSAFPTVRVLATYESGSAKPSGKIRLVADGPHEKVRPLPKKHQFGVDWVTRGMDQGWLELDEAENVSLQVGAGRNPGQDFWRVVRGRSITLRLQDGVVVYEVTRQPGFYDEDGDLLDDELPADVTPFEVFLGFDVKLSKG